MTSQLQSTFGPHVETRAEEWASSATHAIGVVLALLAAGVLLTLSTRNGDRLRTLTFVVFGVSLVALYLASTLYHACNPGKYARMKYWLKVSDHAAIYALIAGTYTPFLLVLVRGVWGWTLFTFLWGLTFVGTLLKFFYAGRFDKLSTAVYVLMGWIGVIAAKPFLASIPLGCLAWLAAGGLAYTGGVVFYMWDNLPFNHAIWHLFVLAGSACHFFAMLYYVVPHKPT